MLRSLVRIVAALLSAGYFWSAWTIYRDDHSFKEAERSEAVAKVEGITELTAAESGLSLPLLQHPSHRATVSFHSRRFGAVVGPTALPASVVQSVLSQRPVFVEYVSNNPLQYRFRGAQVSPVRPLLIGMSLLTVVVLLTLRRSNQ